MTMFADLLRQDRWRTALTVEQTAGTFGVSRGSAPALEVGERWPAWETYDRIAKTFGWPRSFR